MGREVRDGDTEIGDQLVKVAVTGASGFIGHHVLAELARRGVETIATKSPSSRSDIGPESDVHWVPVDISAPPDDCFHCLCEPDVLIHLAWAGLPNYRSLHHFETELPAQYRFLSRLIHQGLPSLLSVGTCFEYGPQSGPLSADAETHPNNPYALAKDTLRKQLEFLRAENTFNLTWARLFYIYGEGQSETSLFSQLKKAVSEGSTTFNMSGGEQLRDYLPVTELARRLVDLALGQPDLGVINVCSGVPISVRSLVEGWIKENGWQIELKLGHYPYPGYEPMAFWGRNSKVSD